MQKELLRSYDFNLPLEDAVRDPAASRSRKMLALAAMGQGLDDAYYSTMQVFEAVERVAADRRGGIEDGEGKAMLAEILAGEGDDYQRRLFYIVSELDLYEAMADLAWLVQLARARARMFPAIQEAGASMPLIPTAVIAENSLSDLLRRS